MAGNVPPKKFARPSGKKTLPRGGRLIPFPRRSAGEWFHLGLRREDGGRLREAAKAYREAVTTGGAAAGLQGSREEAGAVIASCFNLGNVLHRMGKRAEAARWLRRAAMADSGFREAWHNLGVVLEELGREREAERAFRRARGPAQRRASDPWDLR